MQPEKLPRDYADRVAAACLDLAGTDLRHALEFFCGANGYEVDHLTGKQRAEFIAFVAYTIGFDLDPANGNLPKFERIADAYLKLARR